MLTLSNERLSTSKRINHGSDDPAGLITVDQMEAELAALEAAGRETLRGRSAQSTRPIPAWTGCPIF